MKLFEAYKNALFDCGYKWGEEEEKKEINTPLLSETKCYVYIMHDEVNNFYKIGISNKPKYRERTLQSEKPSITLIKAKKFPTRAIAKAFESALHTTYSNKHKRGEWFELDEQDVNQIKESLS
jgi:predicted GIY-YIG superfamily endonuclease